MTTIHVGSNLRANVGSIKALSGQALLIDSSVTQARIQRYRDSKGIPGGTAICCFAPCSRASLPGAAYCSPEHRALNQPRKDPT